MTHLKLRDIIRTKQSKNNRLNINLYDTFFHSINLMKTHVNSFINIKKHTPVYSLSIAEKYILIRHKVYFNAWEDMINELLDIFSLYDKITNFSLCLDVKKDLLKRIYEVMLSIFLSDPELDDDTGMTLCDKINRWMISLREHYVKIKHAFTAINSLNIIHTNVQKRINNLKSVNSGSISKYSEYEKKLLELIIAKDDIINSVRNVFSNVNNAVYIVVDVNDKDPLLNIYFR